MSVGFSRSGHRYVGFVIATFVALVVERAARADLTLAPSRDGYVGAWLVAGPFSKNGAMPDLAALDPQSGAPVSAAMKWVRWTVQGGAGSLDMTKAVGQTGDRAIVAAVLALVEPLDGLLLLGADGVVTVTIDGSIVFARATAHARGAAWDPIVVKLAAGRHTIALSLEKSDRIWTLDARLVDARNLEPPRGAEWILPGVAADAAGALAARLARTTVTAGVVPDGFRPAARLDFPRGAPIDVKVHFAATFGIAAALAAVPWAVGELSAQNAANGVDVELPAVPTEPPGAGIRRQEVHLQVGPETRITRLALGPEAPRAVARGLALRGALTSRKQTTVADRAVVAATLDAMLANLASAVGAGSADAEDVARRIEAFADAVEAKKDPFHEFTGVIDVALPPAIDDRPEPALLHVPASYRSGGSRKYPLTVLLHGYNGTPERIMTAFLGTDSRKPHPHVDGFVLAPMAHGNAFYRGPGESSVNRALDWVLSNYPIDPDRVSIAGHSMGGTGASQFALSDAGRFSTAAALAGYHSYFVRRDVLGRALRDWEWCELTRWSPASFAENGRNLFLYVAQGTRDLPLVHSTVLVDRYQSLGYSVKTEWPDSAHDVWRLVWGDALMWPALAGRRRDPHPKRITLKTDSLRYATDRWVTIDALDAPGIPAKIDATVVAPDRIQVTARDLSAFSLERPSPLVATDAAVTVTVDGAALSFAAGETIAGHRADGKWVSGSRARRPHEKVAGVEGPIRDAWMGPLAFVYGTLDPRQTRAAREVAEHFRDRYSGDAAFPIMPDSAVGADLMRTHSLFLVGSSDANRVVRDLDRDLPLGMSGGGVRAGARRFDGDPELGFACIYPNPKNPMRYVVLVEAANARGLFRAMALPNQLPDLIVFDSALAPAAGQQVLGDARVRAAGYFGEDWALPVDLADKIVVPKGRQASPWVAPWRAR